MLSVITRDEALRLFDFDVKNGRIFWKEPPRKHPRLKGMEAGGPQPNRSGKSYWVIRIGRQSFKRSRLVFLVAHGKLPSPCVDHINGNSLDDRLANLREATVAQNAWNHQRRAKRSPLPMGVRSNPNGRYSARIAVNKRMIQIGTFDTPEQAAAAYSEARRQYYGQFA
jgi:hypothetical protein